jgi:hypothetical protein
MHNLSETWQVIIQLFGMLTSLILFYWKLTVDRKSDEKKRDEKDEERYIKWQKYVREQITDLSIKIVGLEELLLKHIKDSDFRKNIRNNINRMIVSLLRASDLDMSYQQILSYWFYKIEEFSMGFYYSDHRGNKEELANELEQNFEIMLSELKIYIDIRIKDVRMYKGVKCSLSAFLDTSHFFGKSWVLVNTLANNGLDEDRFSSLVVDYIETFHEDLMKVKRVWNTLQQYKLDINEDI